MSEPTKETLVEACNKYVRECCGGDTARGRAKIQEFAGCTMADLLSNPARWPGMVEKLNLLTAEHPDRLGNPRYEAILKFIQALPDGACDVEQRNDVYRNIAAAEELEPTQRAHLLKEFKKKLPGSPSVKEIRAELDALHRKARPHKEALPKDAELILFQHHKLATFFGGIYDPSTDSFVPDFELSEQPRKDARDNLCAFMGKPPQTVYPMGRFDFLPGQTPQVRKDPLGFVVNKWSPPSIRALAKPSDAVPPATAKLLLHIVGNDQAVYEHFVNWLAVAFQTNDRTGTAWVLSGVEGTGKGILFDIILQALFAYCHSRRASEMKNEFNEWFANIMILRINEAHVLGPSAPEIEAALREYITDPTINIRRKNKDDFTVQNYCNVILTSNKSHPLDIPESDRRYNVAPRQEVKLENVVGDTEAFIAQIREELPFFAGFLRDFKADKELARKPMKTEARAALIEDGKRTSERIGRALKAGDLDWFLGEYWTTVGGTTASAPLAQEARKALLAWAKAANPAGASRLVKMNVPAKHVADLHNCLLPERYGMTPQSIGRAIGWKATAWANRSKAYPVTWVTKQSIKELQRTIADLSQVSPPVEDPVPAEDFNKEAVVAEPTRVIGETEPDAEPAFASIVDCPADSVERMKALFVAHGLDPTAEENLDADNTVTVRALCTSKARALEIEEKIIAEFIAEEETA